jgi:hypothetical protein
VEYHLAVRASTEPVPPLLQLLAQLHAAGTLPAQQGERAYQGRKVFLAPQPPGAQDQGRLSWDEPGVFHGLIAEPVELGLHGGIGDDPDPVRGDLGDVAQFLRDTPKGAGSVLDLTHPSGLSFTP